MDWSSYPSDAKNASDPTSLEILITRKRAKRNGDFGTSEYMGSLLL